MQKNKFCTIPNKALIYEDSVTLSQSIIYKNNENDIKRNKNLKKLKESFYNKDFKHKISNLSKKENNSQNIKNYILSKKILLKFYDTKKFNIGLTNINNILNNKKCHITAKYKDFIIYNNKIEYFKKYYKYYDSIKIIPKRESYFKHLMQFIERPIFKNFFFNKISKRIGLDKLDIYRRTNYPNKFNKKIDNNNILSDSNIIFNSNVIETIENCSTSITQRTNRVQNNNKKNKSGNTNEKESSMISEIKNNCNNKKNDNNISCIDNSLLIIMKDLSISQNAINAYLCQHNSNYKNLYDKMKNKTKTKIHNTIINKNLSKNKNDIKDLKEIEPKIFDGNEKNIINNKKSMQTKAINNRDFYKKILTKKLSSNLEKYKEHKNNLYKKMNHNSLSIGKKNHSIKSKFNSNTINSQIINKNSSYNTNKYCLSSFIKNKTSKIHNLKKNYNTNKEIYNKDNNNIYNYSNYSKEKIKDINYINFYDKIMYDLNNKEIFKNIKRNNDNKPKNKSMKKVMNTQKFSTKSPMLMIDLDSLNENETKKKYQTINAVKSISISNNQFFNSKNELKKKDNK